MNQGPPYDENDPATWPDYRRRMKDELNAAGIQQDTIFVLMNTRVDPPEAVPIMIDWLEHLDERVPVEKSNGRPRRGWRSALLRNLITKHARGNQRALAVVLHQFDIDPPLSGEELESATWALAEIAAPSDFDRIVPLIENPPVESMGWVLVQWLGKVKTDAAKELAVSQLANPRTRIEAMRALARQKATGVRDDVAKYLEDEEPAFRKEAEKTLATLPAE